MKLVLIPPGEFMMGSTPEQNALGRKMVEAEKVQPTDVTWTWTRLKEEVPHHITLTKPYWLGMTEVTTGQFKRFVETAKYISEAEKFGFGHSGATKPDGKTTPEARKINWCAGLRRHR